MSKLSVNVASKRLVASLICLAVFYASSFSAAVHAQIAAPVAPGSGTAKTTPGDFNLGSAHRDTSSTVAAPVIVREGGANRLLTTTSAVSAAERIAAQQVAQKGMQLLNLSATGAAVSGYFNLRTDLDHTASSITIPARVTGITEFTNGHTFSIPGSLINSGSLFAVSRLPNVTALIAANSIINQPGGLISTIVPAGGLPGFTSLASIVHLSLQATDKIVNLGAITSSGNLSLIAGNSITNQMSSVSATSGTTDGLIHAADSLRIGAPVLTNRGTIGAVNEVTIAADTINNSGLISSVSSNISISNLSSNGQGLSIVGTKGSAIEALNGGISIQTIAQSVQREGIYIQGGQLLAQTLTFDAGCGDLVVHLDDVAGATSVTAGTADLQVASGSHGMNITEFNVTGDPNLVYTGTGPFTSGAFNSVGGFVAIDTSHDTTNGSITFTGTINTTTGGNGDGGSVTLNAGTSITTQQITADGSGTGNGGNISLTALQNVTTGNLSSNGGGTAGNGGNITVIAGTNSSSTTANIAGISAKGGNSGTGGDIYVMAGQQLTIGNVDASAGKNGGTPGSLTLNNPYAAGAINVGNVTLNATGSTNSFKGFSAASLYAITTGTLNVDGAVNLFSFGDQSVSSINSTFANGSGSSILLNSYGNISVPGGGGIVTSGSGTGNSSGNVEIYAPFGNITIAGPVTTTASNGAASGYVNLFGNTISINNNVDASNKGTAGAGSNINLFASGNLSVKNVTANGGTISGAAGTIILAAGTGGNGTLNAGPISAVATGGSNSGLVIASATGTLTLNTVTLSNAGTGLGGSLYAITGTAGTSTASAQSGTLTVGNIDTSSAGTNSGSVVLVNMGTGGAISTGSLNTSATAPDCSAGSIGIVANGTVTTGAITGGATGASGGANAYGADVFISTGATTANAINVGNINLDATGAAGKFGGNVYFVHPAGATVKTGSISQKGAPAGGVYNGTPTGASSTITGNTTLSFSTSSITGYNPGGFDSITSGAITVVAFDSGSNADPRLLVPIVARGGDLTSSGIVGQTYPDNPAAIVLVGSGNINVSGDITANSTTVPGAAINVLDNIGAINVATVNASGPKPGSVTLYGAGGVNTASGSSILANSTNTTAAGGSVLVAAPGGNINLGQSGNTAGGAVDVSGVTGGTAQFFGGDNFITYETSLSGTGTTGAGGNIVIQTLNGYVGFFQLYSSASSTYANIDVSSTNNLGGSIFISGPQAVNGYHDGACCTGTNQSYFNASGYRSGGSITILSSQWSIGLDEIGSLIAKSDATANTGTGGTVLLATTGEIRTGAVDVSGQNGGVIKASGFDLSMQANTSLKADGSTGTGGRILLLFPGGFQGGLSGNPTQNLISANGVVSGGQIDLQTQSNIDLYNTLIRAQSTGGGTGGVINLASYSGPVNLYQGAGPTTVDASSVSGTGGMIHVIAAGGISSLTDPAGGSSTGSITANGATGGSILLAATNTGGISLSQLSSVTAAGSAGPGGQIILASFGSSPISSTVNLIADGTTAGGSVSVVSRGALAIAGVSANGTSNGSGGTILLSSIGNLSATTLTANANGLTKAGGKVIVTTAQPNPTATGTTLSQSGSATTPFASGTVTLTSISVTGTLSPGSAAVYTSGGAAITGAGGATTSTVKTVLPAALVTTANYTLTPDVIPGGGFTSLSTTNTLTLSGFPSVAPLPFYIGAGGASVSTISAPSQAVSAVAGGGISYAAITTAATVAGNGGSVSLYSLSATANTIAVSGNTTTSGSGSGNTAGAILLDAPLGNISLANNASFNAGTVLLAGTNTISLIAGGDIQQAGTATYNGTSNKFLSFDGTVSISAQSFTGFVTGGAGLSFSSVITQGSLTVADIFTHAGSINLQGTGAAPARITVNTGAQVFANQGNLNIENDNATTGTIIISQNANLTALSNSGQGNVTIVIGPAPNAPVTGSTPTNVTKVTANGGAVYFGKNSITAVGPTTNTVTAAGSSVVFNTGNRAASAISIGNGGGGVNITADPPARSLSGSSLMVFTGGVFFDGTGSTPNAVPKSGGGSGGGTSGGNATGTSNSFFNSSSQQSISFKSDDSLQISNLLSSDLLESALPTINVPSLIPTDLTPIFNSNGQPGLTGITDWDETIPLFPDCLGCGPEQRKRFEMDQKGKPASKQKADAGSNVFKPIALMTPNTETINRAMSTCLETAQGLLWQSDDAKFKIDANERVGVLEEGRIIVWTHRPISIKTTHATISVKAGCLTLVQTSKVATTVRNLYEPWGNSVSATIGEQSLSLSAGEEMTVRTSVSSPEGTKPDFVGRRRVSDKQTSNNLDIRLCEISMSSLLASDALFARALTDPAACKREVDQKVLKLIAALSLATASHGAYSTEMK